MKRVALEVLSSQNNARVIESEDSQNVLLCFTKPMLTNVDHLHMQAFEVPFNTKLATFMWYWLNPLLFENIESVLSRL
jgi:hypothetical protein